VSALIVLTLIFLGRGLLGLVSPFDTKDLRNPKTPVEEDCFLICFELIFGRPSINTCFL